MVAGESQVLALVSSAMLASNDVPDVIGEERSHVFPTDGPCHPAQKLDSAVRLQRMIVLDLEQTIVLGQAFRLSN